jgi:hypothetical protein
MGHSQLILSMMGVVLVTSPAHADSCDKNEIWDTGMAMCMPKPVEGKAQRSLSLRGNLFGVQTAESGPRGRHAFSAPDMFMADLGTSAGGNHYFNLDLMGTAEKWTFPTLGNPELLQIGETNAQGAPFIDAQHPHSSPIMGLTLSDTISLSEANSLKISFAPRGESGDGPIAFMHRTTGEVNPDAPLGHHLGQDAGHISSTVIASSLVLGANRIEVSAFHGAEPEPTKVDLPLGSPNSYSLRLIRDFTPAVTGMVSAAYVKNPEHDDPTIPFVARYSASVYTKSKFGAWTFDNALIFGMITKYDHVSTLHSVGEEFLFRDESANSVFGRIEYVERTAEELAILSATPYEAHGVFAATLGYTRTLAKFESGELGLGTSVIHDFLPAEYRPAYGGDPWTGKVFLRFSGMRNWDI